jgi:hypothetical protein
LAISDAQDGREFASRELAAIEQGIENCDAACGQPTQPCFFLRPNPYSGLQFLRLHQAFHELDLIEADLQEKARKFDQRFFA